MAIVGGALTVVVLPGWAYGVALTILYHAACPRDQPCRGIDDLVGALVVGVPGILGLVTLVVTIVVAMGFAIKQKWAKTLPRVAALTAGLFLVWVAAWRVMA